MSNIKAIVNGKGYRVILENNPTAREFLKLLPAKFQMEELNGNEKFIYLDHALPTNESIPPKIQTGDIMLYGNNCLVIFYKSFQTSYSYTKIGHIEELPTLENGVANISFSKNMV